MNYRHGFHAGNFADVAKHVLLRELVRALQRKPKPFLFLDTHAGRARYDLLRGTVKPSEEWRDGIGRLWERTDLPATVADYVTAVREFNRHAGAGADTLRFYPGSPRLVQQLARPDDRLALCELEPGEARALAEELADARKMRVHVMDGYIAPRAMLPPLEKRALVLIDPPFEAQDEFARVGAAVREGLHRLPAAVVAVWYPLSARAPAENFFRTLRMPGMPPSVAFELRVAHETDAAGLTGCGVVVCNPPWQFAEELRPTWSFLAEALALEPAAGARIEWVVPEAP